MISRALHHPYVLKATGLAIDTPTGRSLLRGLNLSLASEKVALIGRNGVGKSTLLAVLAGIDNPSQGAVVAITDRLFVPQSLPSDPANVIGQLAARANITNELAAAGLAPGSELLQSQGFSLGELRKLHLLDAKLRQPGLLLLDEPTEDLDNAGIAWLSGWLAERTGPTLVVSHNKHLLQTFEHFFIVKESGCSCFTGSFRALLRNLEQQSHDEQRKYLRCLTDLQHSEQHYSRIRRRRQRKKNLGRLHEAGRRPPRIRLNAKRSYAQEKQGRAARIRRDRIDVARQWAKAARRALAVDLACDLEIPKLPPSDGRPLIDLRDVFVNINGRTLFSDLDLSITRERVAIVGPNGSGKTTLVEVMLGHREPTAGVARCQSHLLGAIAQGATDWMSEDSLLTHLYTHTTDRSPDALAALLISHKFPLALAERPLCTLSPGERTRAALICLLQRSPTPEMLVLDEPTYSLDFVGAAAVEQALSLWPGGLVVVSHDADFLDGIGVESRLRLQDEYAMKQ